MNRSSFHLDDPLLLDAQLTDDERAVRDAAHAYCQGCQAPRVLEAFRNEQTDLSIFREMGELGLLGSTIPEQYGGAGSTTSATASWPARSSASTPATAP
jgi:glutaryl-CoA dehydrogenase